MDWTRRDFLRQTAWGLGGIAMAAPGMLRSAEAEIDTAKLDSGLTSIKPDYKGPNVILIRFGGGVRRIETLDPKNTWCPYLTHELTKRGVLFPQMEIDQIEDLETSHGEGTLNLLTGRYDRYRDVAESRPEVGRKLFGSRFEAKVPTFFEYLREAYAVPDHQTLIINGEDRGDEEFYNFSNHHLFGVRHRSQTLSLRRYKMWLWRNQLAASELDDKTAQKRLNDLKELEKLDYRISREEGQGPVLDGFWEHWRQDFGDDGLRNERGDRLLTQLTLRAMRTLKPRMIMVNYQDCDYVHWGYASHYTNGIRIMDEGVRQLVEAVDADPAYRDNTVFMVVPDCGRDSNPFMDVPFQHHFGSRTSREIFALAFGPGIPKGQVVYRVVRQVDVAPTIMACTGLKASFAEGNVLEELWT
jgi:hypothetical protein